MISIETIEMLKAIGRGVTALAVLGTYILCWCIATIIDLPSVRTFRRIFFGIHGVAFVLFLVWSWL